MTYFKVLDGYQSTYGGKHRYSGRGWKWKPDTIKSGVTDQEMTE